ncbi:MAG: hypothetical protein V3V85_02450 [Candidatus Thorarchaeota archaeon]
MKEEEAKTKWCPMARVATAIHDWDHAETGIGAAACNRGNENEMTEDANCLGTACMMWRGSEHVGGCGLVLDESWIHVQNHY